jgi:hypothetical protein
LRGGGGSYLAKGNLEIVVIVITETLLLRPLSGPERFRLSSKLQFYLFFYPVCRCQRTRPAQGQLVSLVALFFKRTGNFFFALLVKEAAKKSKTVTEKRQMDLKRPKDADTFPHLAFSI